MKAECRRPATPWIVIQGRLCALHTLWCAHCPTRSQDGTRVYVLCSCDRPRVVTPAQWEAELDRRGEGSRGDTGTHNLPSQRTTHHAPLG
jgi:hypothetical protein